MTRFDYQPDESVRFGFGENWENFLRVLNEERIYEARRSLEETFGATGLSGRSFLDIGCGSGLFSLVARQMGAKVRSFDYDQNSVNCANELRRRYFPEDPDWQVGQGSILDREFLETLGTFDVVYSYGVLHHTGAMWAAVDNATALVTPGGRFFVALYNDCQIRTRVWRRIKKAYTVSPKPIRIAMVVCWVVIAESVSAACRLLQGKNPLPIQDWRSYQQRRGMSKWHDYVDWVGGYPFEAARPDEIFDFCKARGFRLLRMKTPGPGHVCNEFLFVFDGDTSSPCAE